ncbi:hypothetical protein T4B_10426 [Trichinella pseudospiralis]|uniref:Uncharacterized protein n=1 Tax=Trichinella pseudospiralis TaxID=6337 RepID=A0A0V1GJK0_TRIPS|nr:hypothetical protein T4B_10426 [Trichinella pseudospiralis]
MDNTGLGVTKLFTICWREHGTGELKCGQRWQVEKAPLALCEWMAILLEGYRTRPDKLVTDCILNNLLLCENEVCTLFGDCGTCPEKKGLKYCGENDRLE